MNIDTSRLLGGLQEVVGELAALSDTTPARSFHATANAMLAELRRREMGREAAGWYAQGHALGMALIAAMGGERTGTVRDECLLARLPARIEEHAAFEAIDARTMQLRGALLELIEKAGYPAREAAIDRAVMALLAWEGELFKLPAAPAPASAARPAIDFRTVIERSSREQGGSFGKARLGDCTRLHGGFGNVTLLFTLDDGEGVKWPLVLRAKDDLQLGLDGRESGGEFHLLRYLHRHGMHVAEPLWVEEDPGRFGTTFMVTRQVPGRNFGTLVTSEPVSATQARSLASELARLHSLRIDPDDADLQRSLIDPALGFVSLPQAVGAYLDRWVRVWRSFDQGAYPIVEATLRWLRANQPQGTDRPVLVHGDFAMHNILIDDDHISVLDWEIAHVGDRAEDVSYLLSAARGQIDPQEFMRYYVEAGGREVTDFQLKYYRVMSFFIMMVVMLETQYRFQTVASASPHLCILGLEFIQTPAMHLVAAIEAAEAAR
jgi:aminoglycoside phosphotransferase (APT) family kinase protein